MGSKDGSRCEAVGDRKQCHFCCCAKCQRAVWGTRSVLQPKAEAVERVLTRRVGSCPFPVGLKGERSSFRNAESIRKSIILSMAEHGARKVGRRILDWPRVGLGGSCSASLGGNFALSEVKLGLGGGNDR